MADLSVYEPLTSVNDYRQQNISLNRKRQFEDEAMAIQQQKMEADLQNLQSGGTGGATGELMNRLMAENPNLGVADALAQVQTGFRKGVNFNQGIATPIEGMPQALGAVEYGKESGKRSAELATAGQIAEQKAIGSKTGATTGEATGLLSEMNAYMPKLQETSRVLSELGKKATYTLGGRALDAVIRETGFEPRESSIARAEYIATVDNEILPLLRQTFGAAFTVKEGESLRATLGNANASPEEKDAVLRAFIKNKITQIQALQRQTGQKPTMMQKAEQEFQGKKNNNYKNKYGLE